MVERQSTAGLEAILAHELAHLRLYHGVLREALYVTLTVAAIRLVSGLLGTNDRIGLAVVGCALCAGLLFRALIHVLEIQADNQAVKYVTPAALGGALSAILSTDAIVLPSWIRNSVTERCRRLGMDLPS
jgi:Zn-dependent protease with chaperone function